MTIQGTRASVSAVTRPAIAAWIRRSALGGFLGTLLNSHPTSSDALDLALLGRTSRTGPQPHLLRRIQGRKGFGDRLLGTWAFFRAELELETLDGSIAAKHRSNRALFVRHPTSVS
jgi:hypothetical protein